MEENGSLDTRKQRLWNLIKDLKFGMLTTRHSNGHLHARPMTTQNKILDEDSALWIFTSKSGEIVEDILINPEVSMAYANPSDDSYVSVSGKAYVSHDHAKVLQLWSTMAEAWFPGGPEDPDLALLRIDISHADYWDVRSNKLTQLLKMTTAAVTGKPPTDMAHHGHVDMRS